MATSLKLVFDGSDGKKLSLTFPHANASASSGQVKTLMQDIVGNGEIYAEPPTGLNEAEFHINTVVPVDLS